MRGLIVVQTIHLLTLCDFFTVLCISILDSANAIIKTICWLNYRNNYQQQIPNKYIIYMEHKIKFYPVNNADCTLIKLSNGKTIIID